MGCHVRLRRFLYGRRRRTIKCQLTESSPKRSSEVSIQPQVWDSMCFRCEHDGADTPPIGWARRLGECCAKSPLTSPADPCLQGTNAEHRAEYRNMVPLNVQPSRKIPRYPPFWFIFEEPRYRAEYRNIVPPNEQWTTKENIMLEKECGGSPGL